MNFVIVKPELPTPEFIELLVKYFPEVKDEVLDPDYSDLIHLQVARFADHTNKMIEAKRIDEVKKIFDFFRATIDKVHSEVHNAMYVSFLEHIEFNDLDRNEIRGLLGDKYFNAWRELWKHLYGQYPI